MHTHINFDCFWQLSCRDMQICDMIYLLIHREFSYVCHNELIHCFGNGSLDEPYGFIDVRD